MQFLMPWVKSTKFMLFVLDHKDKKFTWIDPTSTPEWRKDMPYKKYVRAILDMSIKYMSAMRVYDQNGARTFSRGRLKVQMVLSRIKKGNLIHI